MNFIKAIFPKRLIRFASIFSLAAAMLCTVGVPALAKEQQVVKVAFPPQENMTEVDSNGIYSGYVYEYIQKLAQYTDWEVEYVWPPEGLDVNQALIGFLDDVSTGKVDILSGVLKTPETENQFTYPENDCGAVYTTLAALESNAEINSYNFPMHKNVKVAVMEKATARNKETQDYLNACGMTYEFLPCKSVEEQYQALVDGTADVMTSVDLSQVKGTKIVANFAPRPFFMVTTKGNTQLAEEIDQAILTLNTISPNFTQELYEKYFGSAQASLLLNEAQRTYIENLGPIRVLAATDEAPFCFYGDEGEITGFGVDILNKISAMSGISFEIVPVGEAGVSVSEQIIENNCQLALNISSLYHDQGGNLPLSDTYFNAGMTHIYNKNAMDRPVSSQKLALPRGSKTCPHLKGAQVVFYDTEEECMRAVNKGKADVTTLNTYTAEYYISKSAYKNLLVIPAIEMSNGYTLAFSSPVDVELATILDACIRTFESDSSYDLMVPYLTEISSRDTLTIFVRDNPLIIFTVLLAFILLCTLSTVLIVFKRRIHEQNRQLIDANSAKMDFMSRMSHDIRTPMNAVLGMAGLGREEVQDDKAKAYFDKIYSSGEYLLGLINDILDMSRIESGKIVFHEECEDAQLYLGEIAQLLTPMLKEKDITLVTDFSQAKVPYVFCDKLRISQIYINLLSNAIKFSPPGSKVEWTIRDIKIENDRIYFEQTVKDYGCGMSEDFMKKIFTPFEQEKNDINQERIGSGLGLAICKNLVEQMGGTLTAESEIGKGSCFTVRMSHKISPTPPRPKDVSQKDVDRLSGKRILLCEDHPLNTEIAKRLLEKRGMKVECAKNGKQGVDMFASSKHGYYDGVLMDIRMPELDGYEATKQIRALYRLDAKTVPIIAMTANAYDEDKKLSSQAGMNMHLSKPIDPTILYDALAICFKKAYGD